MKENLQKPRDDGWFLKRTVVERTEDQPLESCECLRIAQLSLSLKEPSNGWFAKSISHRSDSMSLFIPKNKTPKSILGVQTQLGCLAKIVSC